MLFLRAIRFFTVASVGVVVTALPNRVYAQISSFGGQSSDFLERQFSDQFKNLLAWLRTVRTEVELEIKRSAEASDQVLAAVAEQRRAAQDEISGEATLATMILGSISESAHLKSRSIFYDEIGRLEWQARGYPSRISEYPKAAHTAQHWKIPETAELPPKRSSLIGFVKPESQFETIGTKQSPLVINQEGSDTAQRASSPPVAPVKQPQTEVSEPIFRPVVRPRGTSPDGRTLPVAGSLKPQGASVVVNTSLTYSRSDVKDLIDESKFEELSLSLEPIIRHEALGGMTLRSEIRFAWQNDLGTSLHLNGDQESLKIERGRTTLTKDFPAFATRVVFGDILSKAENFQTTDSLLGVQFGTAYREIQPFRAIYPGGRRTFQLDRPARVQIFADDVLVGQEILQPGQFDIEQFATQFGTRDISLKLRDDTGGSTVIDFPSAASIRRLNKGIIDFNVSAGFASSYSASGPEYELDTLLASGFVNFGLTQDVTIGTDFQIGPNYSTIGAKAIVASEMGSFEARGSLSTGLESEDVALGLIYSSPVRPNSPRANLRLEYFGDHFPGFRDRYGTSNLAGYFLENPKYRVELSVSGQISKKLNYSVGGYWKKNHQMEDASFLVRREKQWTAFASSQYRLSEKWSAGVSLSANNYDPSENASFNALFTLRRRFGEDKQAEASYASRRQSAALSLSSDPMASIDRTYWQIRAERAERPWEGTSYSGEFDHTANRFNAYGLMFEDRDADTDTTVRDVFFQLDTALAYTNGAMAVGRSVRNSGFVIVKNTNPESGAPAYVDDWGQGDYRARTSVLGAALVGDILPYTNEVLDISGRPQLDPSQDAGQQPEPVSNPIAEPVVYTFPYAGVVLKVTNGPNVREFPVRAEKPDETPKVDAGDAGGARLEHEAAEADDLIRISARPLG